jgi:type I restriction enzyme S subunit
MEFACFACRTDFIIRPLTDRKVGGGVQNLSLDQLRDLLVPLPPIAQQRRIVSRLREQLSILAEARDALEAQLAAAESLPSAHLRAVFESQEAQRWPRKRLGDLTAKIGSGFTPLGGRTAYRTSGVPFIRSQNVLMNSFTSEGLAFITKEQDQLMEGSRVQSDDVLLNITGASIGRVCVVPDEKCPANVNQHVAIIRSNGELIPRFLSFYISNPEFQKFIWRTQAGATRQALTKQIIENFVVPVPSVRGQGDIATELDMRFSASMELQKVLRAKLSDVEKLPAALLGAAFQPPN